MTDDAPRIEAEILRLTAERGADKSICPSEVARLLAPDWRPLMSAIRRVAQGMAMGGQIDILRKGKPVDASREIRGVIRLRSRLAHSPGDST